MDVDAIVSRQVRRARQGRGWKLPDLAQALAEVGVPLSVASLSRIEAGRKGDEDSPPRPVSVRELLALARVLKVPPPYLVTPIPVPGRDKDGRPVPAPAWEPIELSDEVSLHPMKGLQWFLGVGEAGGDRWYDQEPYEAWVRMWVAQQSFTEAKREYDQLLAMGEDAWSDLGAYEEAKDLAKRSVYLWAREYEQACRDLVRRGVDPPLMPDDRLTLVARALEHHDDYLRWKRELQVHNVTED